MYCNCFQCICSYLSIIVAQFDELIYCESEGVITPWNANVDYVVDDKVRKGNKYYKCILAHTSSGDNKPPNETYWEEVIV